VETRGLLRHLDSYQWLENLLAQADANRLGEAVKPVAMLRRFRRVVDSVLRRSHGERALDFMVGATFCCQFLRDDS
jgi:hypothetical protein